MSDVRRRGAWKIERIKTDERSRREYVWQVTCPETPPEPTWDNDFLRGYRCGCRRLRTEGKATRYVEAEVARMNAQLQRP